MEEPGFLKENTSSTCITIYPWKRKTIKQAKEPPGTITAASKEDATKGKRIEKGERRLRRSHFRPPQKMSTIRRSRRRLYAYT